MRLGWAVTTDHFLLVPRTQHSTSAASWGPFYFAWGCFRDFQEWNVQSGHDPWPSPARYCRCSERGAELFRKRDRANPASTEPAKAAAGCRRAKLLKLDTRSSTLRSRNADDALSSASATEG